MRVAGVVLLLIAAPAGAQRAVPDNSPDAAERGAMAGASGFAFSGVATLDIFGNFRGGLARGVRAPVKLAAAAAYDGGNGWTGLASAQYVNGSELSGDLVGDTQTVDNIEAAKGVRVYELWAKREWQRVSLKFGLTDLNTDFDQQEAGALFLNSSDGIAAEFSHTGRTGPSIFPTTGLAVTLGVQPAAGWDLKLGVFDGVPGSPDHPRRFSLHLGGDDGALVVAQATKRWGDRLRIAGGVWGYTTRLDTLDPDRPARRLRASRGIYGVVEGPLFDDHRGHRLVTGWLRAGIADARVNRIASYVGGGVTLASPLGSRDGDDAGISVMRAGFGGPARRAVPGSRRAETTIEATYHVSLGGGLAVQPDVQYVIHPDGAPGRRDAFVAGLRLTLAVSH